MGKARQTVERRHLGLTLKRLREQSGRSQAETGRHIGVSDSRISKVEDGSATVTLETLDTLLEFYSAPDAERETARALGTKARQRQPYQTSQQRRAYLDTLPGSFQRIVDLEADASSIYCYEPGLVPGYLQSPRYMWAMMRSGDGIWWPEFDEELDSRASFRRDRQRRIVGVDGPEKLTVVLTESALIDDGLHTDVMREQLEYLLALLDQNSNICLRVLRLGALDNPAPSAGIIVLDFRHGAPRVGFSPVVYGPSMYFYRDTPLP